MSEEITPPEGVILPPEPLETPGDAPPVAPVVLSSPNKPEEVTATTTPRHELPESRGGSIIISDNEEGEKRIRRTTREIKRPKFDDELVDSGIGLHTPSKRRLSERSSSSVSASDVAAPLTTPVFAPTTAPFPPVIPPLAVDTNVKPLLSAEPSPMEPQGSGTSWTGDQGEPSSSKRHDLRQRTNMISVTDRIAMDEAMQEEEARLERKRRESRIASKDIRAKEIAAANEAAEVQSSDLNTWTVEDDIALVTAITHISDLTAVHRGTLFSRDFTIAEIEERWYRLMYEETFSRQANKRMTQLPAAEILRVQSKTVFSVREEEVLATIPASKDPNMNDMAQLISAYPEDFHSSRTPQVLLDHWHLMRRSGALTGTPLPDRGFPEWDRMERNTILTGANAATEGNPLRAANALNEAQLRLAKVQVDLVAGIVNDTQLGDGAVATLRGRVVRFVLRREHLPVVLGRSTATMHADINLALEGPAAKVSRRQAKITQEPSGEFWMTNLTTRTMFVDGKSVIEDQRVQLVDNSVIEVAHLKLVFRLVHN